MVIFLAGSAWHFVYDWSGGNSLLALIAPVNDSVWEHFKLGPFPFLIYSLIMYWVLGREIPHFWLAQGVAIYTFPFIIAGLFYGYTAIVGHNIVIIDILIFAVSVAVAQWVSYRILLKEFEPGIWPAVSIAMIAVMFVIFGVFTYYPPHTLLFLDMRTGQYGV